jgi:hypothetical protein
MSNGKFVSGFIAVAIKFRNRPNRMNEHTLHDRANAAKVVRHMSNAPAQESATWPL